MIPEYPVYIPSYGRADSLYTAKCLQKDGVPFYVVAQPQHKKEYSAWKESLLVLPEDNNVSGLIMARNYIKEHSIKAGFARHWQLDDNISVFYRRFEGNRIPVNAGVALRACEIFSDRYE